MKRVRNTTVLEVMMLAMAISGLTSCAGSPEAAPAKEAQPSAATNAAAMPAEAPEPRPPLPAIEKSPVSGLPYSSASNIVRPAGRPGELKVLDWAGFKSALTYTFDDGQPSQIEHFAELEAQGVPLTFYISEGWKDSSPDFTATWTKAAKAGFELGNHTVHHSHSGLADSGTGGQPLADMDLEIGENAKYISSAFGQKELWSMASPFGDGGWSEYAGHFYLFNRGVGLGMIAPRDKTDPLNLPVYMARGGERETDLDRQIDKARNNGKWLIFLFHSLLPSSQKWYAPVDIESVTGSIYRARSSGEVWIDALYKVAAYWLGQKIFDEAAPVESGDTVTRTWKLPERFPSGTYLRVAASGGTLSQGGKVLPWDQHGFYEVALDAGSLTMSP